MDDDDDEEETLSSLLTSSAFLLLVPVTLLSENLSLDSSLSLTIILTDGERRKTINQYLNIGYLQYQLPYTTPTAASKMYKY
ncbi:hypothetical protein INT45_008110 [Circinella minor]|uniref:Uncharacterized protein n=1 Tax=Circinella minor TaxID=1195481 RepID=A0A8H7S0B7_9FUNG|nr:hypothetical protein INT45_008110 [Circinella minor]